MENALKLNTGYFIPQLGLGTWNLRGQSCREAVKFTIAQGYRHIDIAIMYRNETDIGYVLNIISKTENLPREDIFITSKIWSSDLGVSKSQSSIDQSLHQLVLSYIDLHLIHWPGSSKKARLETYGVLMKNKQAGKIRSIGVSNFSITQIEEILSEYNDMPSVNQIRMNPFDFDQELLRYCQKKGIVVTAYSPLTQARNLFHPVLTEIAAKYDRSSAQVLLRWGIQQNVVVIPKSSDQTRLIENSKIFDFMISKSDMVELNNLS